jgi:hypothetical protein
MSLSSPVIVSPSRAQNPNWNLVATVAESCSLRGRLLLQLRRPADPPWRVTSRLIPGE